jgi:hypothetical protein
MKKSQVLENIKRGHSLFDEKIWIKFNLLLAQNVSLDASIYFSHLFSIESYLLSKKASYFAKKDYWFICKKENAKSKINMCFSRQDRSVEELKKANLIHTKLGQGKLKWFQIDWDSFISQYNKWYSTMIEERKEKYMNNFDDSDIDEDDDF